MPSLRGTSGIHEIGDRHRHARAHVGVGRVDDPGALRIGLAEIDGEPVALLHDARADRDVAAALAVVVEHRRAAIGAVAPAADDRARAQLGGIEDRRGRARHHAAAELLERRLQPLRAEPHRAHHRGEVAAEVARVAHIGDQHVEEIVLLHAAPLHAQRRHANALLPDLGRGGVVAAMRGAADVALMRARQQPEGDAPAVEDRLDRGEVGQVAAAVIGVVEQEGVAGRHVRAEARDHRLRRPGHGADMHRNVVGLRDELPFGVGHRHREVAARIEDLRVRGADHRLAHLLDDRGEAAREHRDGDGVDARGALGGSHRSDPHHGWQPGRDAGSRVISSTPRSRASQ
jgi:hypothetical protein